MPTRTDKALDLDRALEQYDSKFRFVLLARPAPSRSCAAPGQARGGQQEADPRRHGGAQGAAHRVGLRPGAGRRGRRGRGRRRQRRSPTRRRRPGRPRAQRSQASVTTAPRVLLGVGGGIAAYKAPELVRRLRERGCEVRCALTRAAGSFVAPLALEVVSRPAGLRRGVPGAAAAAARRRTSPPASGPTCCCVAPATAHLLARLALGLADDFLTTTALAFAGPAAARAGDARADVGAPGDAAATWRRCASAAPASSDRWWARSPPARWHGADGGAGGDRRRGRSTRRRGASGGRELAGRSRVLVSAGPTYEPLDPVRFLGNRSSGKMGFALAAEAARRGAARRAGRRAGGAADAAGRAAHRRRERAARCARRCSQPRARRRPGADGGGGRRLPAARRRRRASSRRRTGTPRVELADEPRHPRRARGARRASGWWSASPPRPTSSRRRAAAKLRRKGADFLVANDVSRADIGFGSDWNEVTVFRRDGEPLRLPRQPKAALAGALLDLFARGAAAARRPPRPPAAP